MNKNPTIMLVGGGTAGPVSPLIAVAQELKKIEPNLKFVFVGTRKGPERAMASSLGIIFTWIPAVKLRRYLTFKNLIDIFVFPASLIWAFVLVVKFKPDVIFSAGGFVAVPICWAGKLLRSKIVIHQQDARIGLANRLVSPFAHKITTTFEYTSKNFYSGSGIFTTKWKSPAEWVGNPVRVEFLDSKISHKDFFKLKDDLPIILFMGGGTGSKFINKLVEEALPALLTSNQVIHITGRSRGGFRLEHQNYRQYEFLGKEMADAMKLAHIVVARAGLSTITELSALAKIAIIIPMQKTHQEDNAAVLRVTSSAVILSENELTAQLLVKVINAVKFDPSRQNMLKSNIIKLMPKDAGKRLAKIILDASNSKK